MVRSVVEAASRLHRVVQVYDGDTYARLLTVRRDGVEPRVTPDHPLFVRWSPGGDDDGSHRRQVARERDAHLRACVTLQRSKVVNRPALTVLDPATSFLDALYVLRASAAGERLRPPDERILCGLPLPPGSDAQDLVTRRTWRVPSTGPPPRDPAENPTRVRQSLGPKASHLEVVVVGDRAWPDEGRSGAEEIGHLSVTATQLLRLEFAAVTFAIDDRRCHPVRVDPWPDLPPDDPRLPEVAAALVDLLMS